MTRAIDRRALLLGGLSALPLGCSPTSSEPVSTPTAAPVDVAVIGAGLSGLYCAYRLMQAGANVVVYEASPRVGGRVLSFTAKTANKTSYHYELGGEFIDNRHVTMRSLVSELGLTLDQRSAPEAATFYVDGAPLDAATLAGDVASAGTTIAQALHDADASAQARTELDNTALDAWISNNLNRGKPNLASALSAAFRNQFGTSLDRVSALSLLYLFTQDDMMPAFPTDGTPVFVTHPSNQAIVDQLSAQLLTRVQLGYELVSARPSVRGYELTLRQDAGAGVVVESEHVVFALPFSKLRQVDLRELGLPADKLALINGLVYGTQTKLGAAFMGRPWPAQLSLSGDFPFQWAWDATPDGQDYGLLTNLFQDSSIDVLAPPDVTTAAVELADQLPNFTPGDGTSGTQPKISSTYINRSAARVRWGNYLYSLGSGACYRPGQWSARGVEGRREGNLHFCGEHCSLDFPRTMEGAAETGLLVAAEVAKDLARSLPSTLNKLLELKQKQAQPYTTIGNASDLRSDKLLTRRVDVLTSHADFSVT